MTDIDWRLARTPDYVGSAFDYFNAGREDRRKDGVSKAMRTYMADPKAGIAEAMEYDPSVGIALRDDLRDTEAAQAKAQQDAEDRAAKLSEQHWKFTKDAADLLDAASKAGPEKYAQTKSALLPMILQMPGATEETAAQLFAAGDADPGIYRILSGNAEKELEQFTLTPGSKRFDASGRLVAEAPLSPEYRTLGEGQSLVEVGPGAASAGPTGRFDDFYNSYLKGVEGGFAADDGNGAPVNYGINQKSNPDVDVRNLTPDQAKALLHDRYWKASGADQLPPGLAEIHGDTAVNMGVNVAQNMLRASQGDPQRYMELREGRYRDIARRDPNKAKFLDTWMRRQSELAQFVGSGSTAPGGGARVIAQGPARAPEWEDLPGGGQRNTKTGKVEGVPSAGKAFDNERALVKEFRADSDVQRFRAISNAWQTIDTITKKAKPSGQDDIALTYSFMKMWDPTSVVREGEYALVGRAAGVPQEVMVGLQRLDAGQTLTPKMRRDMRNAAASIVPAAREKYDVVAQKYRDMAGRGGVNPDLIAERPGAWRERSTARRSSPASPAPGTVEGGYRFRGGNPADQSNWVKIR